MTPDFLSGGGEMGALMRAHDWSLSALGPLDSWPQPLRTSVRLLLNTGHPMYIWWGPQGTCLYNDAYRVSIGPELHPSSLGQPAREVWAEIWPLISPQIDQVMAGRGATWNVDHLVPITRHGQREDVFWTYSYSPIDDPDAPSGVGGVLVICSETTRQVLAARRAAAERDRFAQLFEQAPTFMALLRGPEHRFEIANPAYLRLVGHRPVVGRTVAEALPEAVAQGYLTLLDRVYASGKAYLANGSKFEIAASADAPALERYVDFVYQPIRDVDGSVNGIFVIGADVTERTLGDASLRDSEARFRAALHAGRMGSWETDHTTRTRHWSPEGMALFGLTLPDGIGQVGGPDDEYVGSLHPDDRHLAQRFRTLSERQDSFSAAYRIVRPDGTTLWLEGRGQVVRRGPSGEPLRLVSIMMDATERKLIDDQLRMERERLELALRAGGMGAYEYNVQTDELWWSAQVYAVFGLDPEQFVPTPERVIALIHPDDREAFIRVRAEAIEGHRSFTHEFRTVRPDGTVTWIGHRGQAEYDASGAVRRSFGVSMDITERKQLEQILRDADKSKDEFIAILAHELRNPLAPIRNAVAILRHAGARDATAGWCHDVIDRQVAQMTRLLDDLLDVSRLSRGRLRLRMQPVLLSTVIERAVEIAQPPIEAARHTFTVHQPEEPLTLNGDLTRLAQVFSNLLINAAKFTPPGGAISLRAEREVEPDGSAYARVLVTDTGVGIAAQDLVTIFHLFGQAEAGLDQNGQGIGLSLAKGLIEMHGGQISAHSEGPNRGATFEVRLPLIATAARVGTGAGGAGLATPAATPVPPREAPSNVLIADDVRDVADSLALLLRGRGHHVEVAYDGEQAVALADALHPDVVLLDLGMPRLDGYATCREIRARPWGSGVLLVAQSGWGEPHDRERSRAAGFDHHLTKPVKPETLISLFRPAH